MSRMIHSYEPCIICGGLSSLPLYSGLVRCTGCGHVFFPLSGKSFIPSDIYDVGYFNGNAYADYAKEKPGIQKNSALRLKQIERIAPLDASTSLLEIGCAYGFFLETVAPRIREAVGFDISTAAVDRTGSLPNARIFNADYLLAQFPKNHFDITCVWDTLEHLQHPGLVLEKIAEELKPGGLVAVTTPDAGSLVARIWGSRWRHIDPPRHLHYFSQKSLSDLMARYGLQTLHIEHCGYYRSIGFISRWLSSRIKGGEALGRLFRFFGISETFIYANVFDVVFVIARKKKVGE